MPPMLAALLRTFRRMQYSPLTKREIRMQGPFLVSTEISQTEPIKDFLTVANVAKLVFSLVFAQNVFGAKKGIEESSACTKEINEKMGDLVKELPNVNYKMEESTVELKKLNEGVLKIHKEMIKNSEMEGKKKLKLDDAGIYISKELMESFID